MGIYSGSERIETVKFGNADMVCMMQDNHILALGKKYWAIKIKDIDNWNYGLEPAHIYVGKTNIPAIKTGDNIYLASFNVASTYDNKTMYLGYSNFNIFDNSVTDVSSFLEKYGEYWFVYEFDTTLYEKRDIASITWSKTSSYTHNFFYISGLAKTDAKVRCLKYTNYSNTTASVFGENAPDMSIASNNTGSQVFIRNDSYNTPSDFSNGMRGIPMLFEKA